MWGSEKPTAEKTTTVTATPTATKSDDLSVPITPREQVYLKLVRDDFPQFAGQSDQWWLGLAHTICDAVEVDSPIEVALGLLKGLTENGWNARQAGAMLAYASALCPEKQAALSIE